MNLASKEYSRAVERYVQPKDRFLTLVFGELSGGKVKQKGTLAKIARGEMARYMAENQVEDLDKLRGFHVLGYEFSKRHSTEKEWVFLL